MRDVVESVACAAVWYKDIPLKKVMPESLPVNCDRGVVVCGHRHNQCISVMVSLTGLRSVRSGPDSVGEYIQGFLTTKNRFVDRLEAAEIAVAVGQVNREELINPRVGLFSEDLY
jgi:hypothetical protein